MFMIKSLSENIVNQMIENEVIDPIESEYYSYRIITLIESIITVFTILVISIILNKSDLAVFFLLSFMALRRQTGGFHLDSFVKCYIFSVLFSVAEIICIEFIQINTLSLTITVLSGLVIMVVGCVNHPNLDFNESELVIMKKRARITALFEFLILIALSLFNIREDIIASIELAIILCSILIVLAKLLRQEV
jgi:accessory gene regulator B